MVKKENYYALRTNELKDKDIINKNEKDSLKSMISSPDKENGYIAKEIIRLKIAKGLIEGLNQGQVKAFLEIITFFREGKKNGIVIKGYAGTGKTFLVKRVVEYITTSYPNRHIAITAPTNKAVHVLCKNAPFKDKSSIFEEHGNSKDKIVYSTIHKLLGLKEKISDNGVQTFETAGGKNKSEITKYKYFFLDEVSMLDDQIFHELMKFNDKVKFIFLGDPAQIPPVGKEHCLPFMPEDHDYNLKIIELTEHMRQKGEHPIVDYSMILRKNLILEQPLPDLKTKLTDNGKGEGVVRFNAKTQRHMVKKMINILYKDARYQDDSDFVKLIAWRNKTVVYLNDLVRESIYGKEKIQFNIGDKLIANKPLFERVQSKIWGGYQYLIKANTSDEFKILKIEKIHKIFKESYKNSPEIKFDGCFWKLRVSTINNKENEIFVIHEDSLQEYNEVLKEIRNLASSSRSSEYWVMYYNMTKWNDNITYNYAITAHKSQGSGYQNVILIEEDLDFNKKIIERNRIKYTAYTRAINRLYVLR